MYPKLVIIGSNPSQGSIQTLPFWNDTKSRQVLDSWTKNLYWSSMKMFNVVNHPTDKNRPLKMSEIKAALPALELKILAEMQDAKPIRIITLGKTADKALTLLGVEHLAMPHPSGLNRQLNDKDFVAQKIKMLQDYCSISKDQTISLD